MAVRCTANRTQNWWRIACCMRGDRELTTVFPTVGMMDYGMGAMPMMPTGDPTGGFMDQLQDGNKAMVGLDASSFDMDLAIKNQNRNRGNYRCSKVRGGDEADLGLGEEADRRALRYLMCSVASPRRATCVRWCRRISSAIAAVSRRSRAAVLVRGLIKPRKLRTCSEWSVSDGCFVQFVV